MIELFTEITLDSIIVFFAFGMVAGIFYYAIVRALSRLSIFLSKETMRVLLKGQFRELTSLFKQESETNFGIKFCDLIRAFFVLISGFIFIFINFVFIDGITRIYTILFLFFGVCFSKIIVKSKMFSIIFDFFFYFFKVLSFALFLPIKFAYCILTKKG